MRGPRASLPRLRSPVRLGDCHQTAWEPGCRRRALLKCPEGRAGLAPGYRGSDCRLGRSRTRTTSHAAVSRNRPGERNRSPLPGPHRRTASVALAKGSRS